MNNSITFKLKTAAVILALTFVGSNVYAADSHEPTTGQTTTGQPTSRHAATKKPTKPSVEDEILQLRQDLEGQINNLKIDLAAKDAELKQAQQAAADAQTSAANNKVAASAQQQATADNSAAVSRVQSSLKDLKGNQASLATTVSDATSSLKKAIAAPEAINFKGITISPTGSFIAAETVDRTAATGGGINTQFTGIPLQSSDAAQLSEFQGSGRQSRLALKAIGKLDNVTLTGYYEMDWLGTGITSNNNQSNSYVLRQRQLWAQAALTSGWTFTGGQMWSLVAETSKGMLNGSEILPGTIDPQYEPGFVWARQYGFRVTKAFNQKFSMGISAENAETLNPVGSNLPTNLLIGAAGNGGGLYNPTANYSFNRAPDFVVKMAMDPGWGHWELFGIGRSFRDRIYPSVGTPNNNTVMGGGVGGGFRGPLAGNKISVGVKGLWGQGVGRYGSSTIADITLRPDGTISPLHGFSALSTVELNPTPRLMIYLNYGGDYIGRDYTGTGSTAVGYGIPGVDMSGCRSEGNAGGSFSPTVPAHCGANNKDVQEDTAGYWFDIYKGPKGRLRQGLQYSYFMRNLWSGAGGTTNPGGGARGTDNEVYTSFRYYLP